MRRWRLEWDIWVAIMSSRVTADEGKSVSFSSRKASDLPRQQHPHQVRKTTVDKKGDARSDPAWESPMTNAELWEAYCRGLEKVTMERLERPRDCGVLSIRWGS
jgi:hypothetical protein